MFEEYRSLNETIEVSNLGNIRKNGKMIKPSQGEFYDYICINGKMERVHILVGELFQDICGEHKKRYHLHHINGNQRDNRAENLVWLSPSEHKKLHQREDGVSVPVQAYDINGNYVGRWDSKTQAAAATGAEYRHISEIIAGKTRRFTANKLYWFPVDEPAEKIMQKISEIQRTKYQSLRQIKRKKIQNK